ncbi:MAG TPA: polysaccharide deacetylase family protein [Solirubrobacteraceae bacterium]|jgi:peptidoglycan/xylan/chitin deacetylase (PgdA/CDA1 family)|nr:polysaccharide deacetylase family protein [Solirubrobacteraceae bacterium]
MSARFAPITRSRAIAIAASLPVALLLSAGTPGSRTPARRADRAPAAVQAASGTKPGAAALYRIVGCVSRGGPYRGGPAVREVAIGFDDGPAPDTGAFVTMLERLHANATFFMIGRQIGSQYRAELLRELRNGDVLGDHTFTHPDLLGSREVRAQLHSTLAVIRGLSGYTPCVFRPPYGAYDGAVVSVARSLGLATVLWNVDPSDWARPGVKAIERTVLAEVRPGSIIISHDGGGPRGETLAAYPAIISALRARHFRIVTIPQLLGFKPVYRPCVKLCDGIGVPRSAVPRDAVLQSAPGP